MASKYGKAFPGPSPPPGGSPHFEPSPELSATQISASTNKTCTLAPSLIKLVRTPQQPDGLYFVDGTPNRSDIRSDPSNGSVQEGITLSLVIHVYNAPTRFEKQLRLISRISCRSYIPNITMEIH